MLKLRISAVLVMMIPYLCTGVPFLSGVGGKPDKNERLNYAQRASNYDGKAFYNMDGGDILVKAKDIDENRMSAQNPYPDFSLPYVKSEFKTNPDARDFTVTWLGHSTVFIQMNSLNILIDPIFSKRISPVQWAGPRRFSQCPVSVESLPDIDIVIYTHDHYDHLDYPVVKKIDSKVKQYIVPLGVECHLKKWGVSESKITNFAWWESLSYKGVSITSVPARHFSGRWITGRNSTLWCGYVLFDGRHKIYISGDSGYGSHFKAIHEKFGDFDLAVLECGQYNKKWPTIHSFPEQTVNEAVEVGAKLCLPVHWGAVVLSSNGWDDSILRFVKNAEQLSVDFITPMLGETVNIDKSDLYKKEWYKIQNICSMKLHIFLL